MKTVRYITGNQKKFDNANAFFADYGITSESQKVEVTEIQSEDAVQIAVQKARDAYEKIGEPLFVNDASWHIHALNGFPGPYMRYVMEWFTADDILKLLESKEDRTIILRDTIVYKDASTEKVFTNDVHGVILEAPTEGNGPFITKIVSFEESGQSIAEANIVGYSDKEKPLWQEFAQWLTDYSA